MGLLTVEAIKLQNIEKKIVAFISNILLKVLCAIFGISGPDLDTETRTQIV